MIEYHLRPDVHGQHHTFHGVGFNWFDYLGMGGYYAAAAGTYDLLDEVAPPLEDEASWKALLGALTRFNPGFIRFGLPPDPHVREDGSFTTQTVHWERLRRLSVWAKENGCTILLDTFLIPTRYALPLPPGTTGMRQFGTRDNREYAREFVVPLLKAIATDTDFEAVRYFNPVNEPHCYGVWDMPPDGPDTFSHYVEMYREMRTALDVAEVPRTRIGLVGLDLTFFYVDRQIDALVNHERIDPYLDAYSIHFYQICFDHERYVVRHLPHTPEEEKEKGFWAPMEWLIDHEARRLADYCATRRKPLFAPEIGTFYYGWRNNPPGAASYDAQLTTAEGIVRCLNVGISSFAFWSLLNPNTIDGHWRTIGVKDGKVSYERIPSLIRGLLTQVVRPGMTVTPMKCVAGEEEFQHLHATSLRDGNEVRTMILINDHPTQERTFQLHSHPAWKFEPAYRIMVTREWQTVVELSTPLKQDEIPPSTFVIYTMERPKMIGIE